MTTVEIAPPSARELLLLAEIDRFLTVIGASERSLVSSSDVVDFALDLRRIIDNN
jgi:hypothetical protein